MDEEELFLQLAQQACPLCSEHLPKTGYRWYCTDCDALVKKPNRRTPKGGWHRTKAKFCSTPMLYVKVAISCSHQFASEYKDIALLNAYKAPLPPIDEILHTKTGRQRIWRRRIEQIEQEKAEQLQKILDLGLTPVDPEKYKKE